MGQCQCSKFPCSCGTSTNFWISSEGKNTLKGCECDPNNPPVLPIETIIHIIMLSPKAKQDFLLLYPSLFPCEKEKFDVWFKENPWTKKKILDDHDYADAFQSAINKTPIYAVTLSLKPNNLGPWNGC